MATINVMAASMKTHDITGGELKTSKTRLQIIKNHIERQVITCFNMPVLPSASQPFVITTE